MTRVGLNLAPQRRDAAVNPSRRHDYRSTPNLIYGVVASQCTTRTLDKVFEYAEFLSGESDDFFFDLLPRVDEDLTHSLFIRIQQVSIRANGPVLALTTYVNQSGNKTQRQVALDPNGCESARKSSDRRARC
jgi:hypothetical protein